jgi:hypothetical protein
VVRLQWPARVITPTGRDRIIYAAGGGDSKQQTAKGDEQGAESGGQTTLDRRPTTDDRRPTTDDRRPTTEDRRPTTDKLTTVNC